ncbi:hypothetical protein BYT27DRAFT_7266186 [Phlegmacium glaucopus]|nr:hypothetical protein BYT27DRAFT_7266186 [Phlegmacium glaucopus]
MILPYPRIMGKPLNPEVRRDSMAACCLVMKKIERKPHNSFFTMIGSESYRYYMVVTQSELFLGWKGMDPELVPKFEEGEREAAARELLKAEGVTQLEFRIELYQSRFRKAVLNYNDYCPLKVQRVARVLRFQETYNY